MDNEDKALLKQVAFQMNEVWDAIYGNGQPGVLQRVTRLETKVALAGAGGGLLAGGVVTLVAAVL